MQHSNQDTWYGEKKVQIAIFDSSSTNRPLDEEKST